MHRKGKTYRKVEGMLNNRSKLWWMKSHRQIRPWQNASATEDMLSTSQNDMNMQLQKQTERSWIEPVVWNQSFVLCFTDQMGSLPIWFTFNHIWIKQNYTFFFFFFSIEFTIPKTKLKLSKTTPVHLLHTIGSQKYFGHFAFQQTAAFHYKKVVWVQTLKKNRWKA